MQSRLFRPSRRGVKPERAGRWRAQWIAVAIAALAVGALRPSTSSAQGSDAGRDAAAQGAAAGVTSTTTTTTTTSSSTTATPPAARATPTLVGLTAAEFDALRPLAARGAAVMVREPTGGARARITVVVRARAPLATVHRVIATPEQYRTFMPAIANVEVLSRRGPFTAFRFGVSAVLFNVVTLSALHVVSDRRIDITIVQSDIGPGASRWDLLPDGDGTLVALSTWGDPSQGNWVLQQLARRSPAAIAGFNISADLVLALGVARRAEIVSGLRVPVRPAVRSVATGPLVPMPAGAWTDLARRGASVGCVTLDAQGAVVQTAMTAWTSASPDAVVHRLEDVAHYDALWRPIRALRVVSSGANVVRFHSTVESMMARTEGEQERVIEPPAGTARVVFWRGVAGDFSGHDHRWDIAPDAAGGTLVTLTGGSEYERASWVTRRLIDTDVWLTAGYATSFKLVWLHPLLAGL